MKLLKLFKRNFLKIALIVVMSGITTAATYAQVSDIKPFWGGAAEQIYNKHGALVIMDTTAPVLVNPIPTGLSQLSLSGIPLKLFVDTAVSAFSDVTSRGKIHVIGCTSTSDGRVAFGTPNATDPDACAKVHGEVLATRFLPAAGDITPNRNLCADVNGVVTPCAAAAPTAFSCTGTTPANSQLCFRDNLDLTQDTPKTLAWFCGDMAKCEYRCATGYYFNLQTQVCTANPPAINTGGIVMCPNDASNPYPWTDLGSIGLPSCVNGTLVPASSSGSSTTAGNGTTSYVTNSWQCAGNDINGNPTIINCSAGFDFDVNYNLSYLNT
jgi:hypothetical protein